MGSTPAILDRQHYRYQSTGRKGQITVVACGNAARQILSPLINFDAKNIRQAWMKNEVPGTMYGSNNKGWINTELFESWFTIFFYQMQDLQKGIL